MASIWRRHRNHIHKLVMGSGSKSQVRFGFKQCFLGSVWVQVAKRLGFSPGFSGYCNQIFTSGWVSGRSLDFHQGFGFSGSGTHHQSAYGPFFAIFTERPKQNKNSGKHNFYHYNNTDLREHFASISWTGHLHFTKTTIFRSGGQRPKSNCPFMRPIPAMMIEAIKHWVVQIVLR